MLDLVQVNLKLVFSLYFDGSLRRKILQAELLPAKILFHITLDGKVRWRDSIIFHSLDSFTQFFFLGKINVTLTQNMCEWQLYWQWNHIVVNITQLKLFWEPHMNVALICGRQDVLFMNYIYTGKKLFNGKTNNHYVEVSHGL